MLRFLKDPNWLHLADSAFFSSNVRVPIGVCLCGRKRARGKGKDVGLVVFDLFDIIEIDEVMRTNVWKARLSILNHSRGRVASFSTTSPTELTSM